MTDVRFSVLIPDIPGSRVRGYYPSHRAFELGIEDAAKRLGVDGKPHIEAYRASPLARIFNSHIYKRYGSGLNQNIKSNKVRSRQTHISVCTRVNLALGFVRNPDATTAFLNGWWQSIGLDSDLSAAKTITPIEYGRPRYRSDLAFGATEEEAIYVGNLIAVKQPSLLPLPAYLSHLMLSQDEFEMAAQCLHTLTVLANWRSTAGRFIPASDDAWAVNRFTEAVDKVVSDSGREVVNEVLPVAHNLSWVFVGEYYNLSVAQVREMARLCSDPMTFISRVRQHHNVDLVMEQIRNGIDNDLFTSILEV